MFVCLSRCLSVRTLQVASLRWSFQNFTNIFIRTRGRHRRYLVQIDPWARAGKKPSKIWKLPILNNGRRSTQTATWFAMDDVIDASQITLSWSYLYTDRFKALSIDSSGLWVGHAEFCSKLTHGQGQGHWKREKRLLGHNFWLGWVRDF